MPEPESREEVHEAARRALTLCNICDYCSGYCETFVAAGRRRAFTDGDLTYLANLCHNCRACFHACQYAPPHDFNINLPRVLGELRQRSYRDLAWPHPKVAGWAALPMAVVAPLLAALILPGDVLFGPHRGPGAFYEVTPLLLLVTTAGLIGAWALLALTVALVRFWRQTGGGGLMAMLRAIPGALSDILSLRNLDGGGHGCNDMDDSFSRMRRWLHHALFYGFLCCLASTAAAHAYHHFLGRLAPYPLTSLPVLLGAIGRRRHRRRLRRPGDPQGARRSAPECSIHPSGGSGVAGQPVSGRRQRPRLAILEGNRSHGRAADDSSGGDVRPVGVAALRQFHPRPVSRRRVAARRDGASGAGWRRRSDRRSDLDFHRHSLKCAAHAEKSAGATGKAVERHRHEFGSQRRITSLVPIEDEIADASLRVPLTRRKNVLICGLRLALSVCEC